MRLPKPDDRYDAQNEAATRRLIEQELNRETTIILLGGGRLYEDATTGNLVFRGRSGTVTILALA